MTKASELGISIAVVVLDEGGHVRYVARMDRAGWFTPEIARGKAYAAAAFRIDTRRLVERFAGTELFAGALTAISRDQMAIGAGGMVIQSDGETIGAVGVSGGRGEQDVECAEAGLGAI